MKDKLLCVSRSIVLPSTTEGTAQRRPLLSNGNKLGRLPVCFYSLDFLVVVLGDFAAARRACCLFNGLFRHEQDLITKYHTCW